METIQEYDAVISLNVDPQNDFCPGGRLAVLGGDEVMEPLNTVNKWVRDKNGYVIFTADWHPEDTVHFNTSGGPWPPHCIRYKAGAAFHDDLEIGERDNIALKGTTKQDDGYSGWLARLKTSSPLYIPEYSHTRAIGVSTVAEAVMAERYRGHRRNEKGRRIAVVVGGLATDYCVKETVLDALDDGRRADGALGVYVVRNAIRAVNIQPGDGDRAIAEMQQAGAEFVTSDQIVNGEVFRIRSRS